MDRFTCAQKKALGEGSPNARISVYEKLTTEEPMLNLSPKGYFIKGNKKYLHGSIGFFEIATDPVQG